MKPNVEMKSELIMELQNIAARTGVLFNDLFRQVTEEYIETQARLFKMYDEISGEEIMYDLFGAAWRSKLKEAEKENKRMNAVNKSIDKVVAFPSIQTH